ncbi:preprotein translocase subunit YajC [Kurthia sibirica]|uniref:Preprotein translocase subunit YajC n=1 Tax=Kurthia sibirica TaxID=202750 RepID=A0A2U3AIG7_9BACL|nr:preprotein translocase subunit YajC [Kurthia sibirica]PWI24338.1 preprotein translocase subunit YajC [Kurthia sibirica]GEK34376.1 preprotein translocase subunit YajC [Kurthia sibirica]
MNLDSITGFLPMIVIIALMYFMLIRPASKQRKKTASMQSALSRGNKIVTIGGLHATIDAIDDKTAVVVLEDGTKMRFERQAIGRVLEDSEKEM